MESLCPDIGSNHPVVLTSYLPLPLSPPPPPPPPPVDVWLRALRCWLYYTLRFSHLLKWIVRVPLIDANFLSSNLSSTILFFISLYEGGFLCSLLLKIKYLTRIKI